MNWDFLIGGAFGLIIGLLLGAAIAMLVVAYR